jgi:hypothetical protein
VQAFLIVRERQQFQFEVQVPLARFRRAAHAGEAVVFRSHHPIFGGTEHKFLPRNVIRPAGGGTHKGPINEVMELKVRTHSFAFRVAAIVRLHRVRVEKMLVFPLYSAPLARPLAPRVTTWMPDWGEGAFIEFPGCVLALEPVGIYLKKGIFLPEGVLSLIRGDRGGRCYLNRCAFCWPGCW